MIDDFLSDKNLDLANFWLKRSRKHHPACSDVWAWLHDYPSRKAEFVNAFRREEFYLSPMRCIHGQGRSCVIWSAQDAWALRALTQVLESQRSLLISEAVSHIRREPGTLTNEMRLINSVARQSQFVCRTDIRGFYANIPKITLLDWCWQQRFPSPIFRLLQQYIYYQVEDGGIINTSPSGIPRATGLSNFLTAAVFYQLDESLSQRDSIFYRRYMDDFLMFSQTRWPIRRAIKRLHKTLTHWDLTLHPEKTYIGRTSKGFDWMGFQWQGGQWQGASPRSLEKSYQKRRALVTFYGADSARVAEYDKHYQRWVKSAEKYNSG
ncbi:reverse transcriptase domain-containing protein [Vibrio owensii]|uniref:reverse transcriptase domain-containing protein n=1 Tax=Vibrio owensii TaxID=696485 RepID=UPI0003A272E9|nr:reverse transcriptase domain-containing protein [Vibrio owensii]